MTASPVLIEQAAKEDELYSPEVPWGGGGGGGESRENYALGCIWFLSHVQSQNPTLCSASAFSVERPQQQEPQKRKGGCPQPSTSAVFEIIKATKQYLHFKFSPWDRTRVVRLDHGSRWSQNLHY